MTMLPKGIFTESRYEPPDFRCCDCGVGYTDEDYDTEGDLDISFTCFCNKVINIRR